MSQNKTQDNNGISPVIKKQERISLVWLIPILTLLIGTWLIFKTINDKGPEITITFKTAEGVEAGKTRVKYKNVDIGIVESTTFAKDLQHVRLKILMDKETREFIKRDTKFWVVRPRLSLRGVSGLGTLVSGAYIEIEPGEGAEQTHFIGLEEPPIVKANDPGKEIVLQADKLGSIDIGSPVYYRGIGVGEVQSYELGNDRRSIFIHAFIKAPYDELVKGNSRFWNVSGIDISLGSEGLQMRTQSMQALMLGGIAFDTPQSIEASTKDIEELVFSLHESFEKTEEQSFTTKINFVLFFEGSVRGLNIGAPVEFKGIKIGKVIDVRLEFDPAQSSFRIPVLIEIEPERVVSRGESNSPYETLKTLVEQGLRARLQTGSLLTGQLFVELDMLPDTRVRLVSGQNEIPELPTIPAQLDQIASSVKGLLSKLDKLKIVEIGDELEGTLKGLNKLTNAPDLQLAISELKSSLSMFKQVMTKLDPHVEPMAENIESTMEVGTKTLEKLQSTLGLVDGLIRSDSPMQFRFIEMADELSEAARSIRSFLELLEEDPQSLIFGKGEVGE